MPALRLTAADWLSNADEKQRLQGMIETQEAVLEKYSGILEEKRSAHARTKMQEKRRLEGLLMHMCAPGQIGFMSLTYILMVCSATRFSQLQNSPVSPRERGGDAEYRWMSIGNRTAGHVARGPTDHLAPQTNPTYPPSPPPNPHTDLQRSVADFLGEGQTDAGDAIGNMKRLLQLLADKSKQQSRQIQSLEIEKEKLDHLNVCRARYTEQQCKTSFTRQ